ncbi:zinc finger, CCHC-type containing protein [Tanacetum coccineum]
MLMTMEPDLQWNLETLGAYDMLKELKTLFAQQAEQELLQTVREFHACKQEEKHSKKKPQLAARGNNKGKGKSKLAYAPKPKIPPPPKKEDPAKDSVYDTGCGTHICNTTQGFRRSWKLKPGALSLYIGNGECAAIEAIRSYDLCFPIGLVMVLHNCHYAPSIIRGVISVSRLYDDGFINRFENDNSISVSKDNLIYFNADRGYPKETMGYSFYYPPKNKVFVAQNAEFFKNSLITQKASGSLEDLEIIQEEDTHPSENTSSHHDEDDQEINEPQSDIIPIHRRNQEQPEGFVNPKLSNQVCKLKRSIYGLKQASKQWNKRFDDEIKKFGFTQNRDEPSVSACNMYHMPSAMGSIIVMACEMALGMSSFTHNITSRFQQNIELRVSCYTDVGYLTDADDLKSQTRYVFVLNGGVVDWKSTKQSIFATSSAESESIAASNTSKEAVWVRKLIDGLGVVPTIEEPIKMYCDNTGAITIANESGITKGARHYHAKVHYLREVIEYGDVKIENVHTDDNLADPFTKALAFP